MYDRAYKHAQAKEVENKNVGLRQSREGQGAKSKATIRNDDDQPYSFDRNASPQAIQAAKDMIPQSSSPIVGDVETKTAMSSAAIAARFTKLASIGELDSANRMTVS